VDVLKKLPKTVFWKSERDKGQTDAINKGITYFKSLKLPNPEKCVFAFINSDDYLLPGALKQVSDFFTAHSPNTFVTGYGFTEDGSGHRTVVTPSKLTAQTMLHRSAVMFQQTTFFPALLYKTVGCFNNENRTCWDYELFLNFLQLGAEHYVLKSDLAVFRLYQDSISGSGRLEDRYFRELDQLFLKYVGRERSTLDKLFTYCLRAKREIARRIFNVA
jgi:hypothetical protein